MAAVVRLLISGAGGFVGGHLAAAMARNRNDVVALCRRFTGNTPEQRQSICLEQADLTNEADLLPDGPFDAIMHCAAAIPSAVTDEAELIRINVEGSRRLFAHGINSGARVIVFCSSMAIYGDIAADTVDPDTTINAPGAYGRSKLQGEAMLAELCRTHANLRALSIRLPGVVGPGSHHNFLSDTLARLVAGKSISVRNPDALFNNVVHIDDLTRFADRLFKTLPTGHRAATIASVEPLPIRDVVCILQRATAATGMIKYRNEGHSFLVSSDHACSLGYEPATVRDAVERFTLSVATGTRDSR
jgi:nucleoside-diphosphate-sugar epimerase